MTQEIDIGIPEPARKDIAEGLCRLLGDTYSTYLKTQYYHWNVTGPHFQPLHDAFEDQYRALAEATDVIAERIRALGHTAPGTFGSLAELSSVASDDDVPEAEQMIAGLIEAHETVVRTARSLLPKVDQANDVPTEDLLTERMRASEKTAWMLRSQLN